jgi:GMP synthase PP-ATPase subunit
MVMYEFRAWLPPVCYRLELLTAKQIIVLRAVTTTDFMTAEAFNFPWDFLQRVMNRIVNEVHGYVLTGPIKHSLLC